MNHARFWGHKAPCLAVLVVLLTFLVQWPKALNPSCEVPAFLKNAGRVLSRQQLMDVTHGAGWHAYERTIDAQISRLRKKLEADPKKPKLLKSVHGDGYVFTATVSRQGAQKN